MTSPPTAAGAPPDAAAVTPVRLVTRAFMRDPYPALRALCAGSPAAVPIIRNGFRMWVLTRYADVRRVMADRSVRRDVARRMEGSDVTLVRPQQAALLPPGFRRGVIDRDGADHERLRALVEDDFRLNRMEQLRPRVEQLANALLDELPLGEPVDLVARFTRPLAATVISELVGLPEHERAGFPLWENSILTGTSREEITDAGEHIYALCRRMVALKRADPRDDVMTRLVRAERDGRLDEDEAASTLGNLLIGGMETSTTIGTGIALLLTHRDQLSLLLEDSELLPGCVEEILRFEGPFRLLGPRFADEPLAFEGITIPAGELIALCPAAANRDPRRFSDPERFDITRRPNPHLAFGRGPHHCLGVHLGRLQTAVGLETFFSRVPRSRLDVAWEDLAWRPGAYQRRLASLPVVLEAAP
jgi:cytochrome P450 PksS